jgi:cytochrome c-type biogenesis protein
MERLFTALTHAVEGTPAIALTAAFVWGILSILLSPCHLSSIPLIIGFIDKQGRMSAKRAFTISTLFAVGILITIAAVGAITAARRMVRDVGPYGSYCGGHLLPGRIMLLISSRPMVRSGRLACR